MQTFRFIKVTRYHEGINEKSAYMVLFPHNQLIAFPFDNMLTRAEKSV